MERTESTLAQVAPNYENEKIQEMQEFGWSLHGRQEIHEEGNSSGREGVLTNSYVVTTSVSHYVKLHFVRNLNMPNLDNIRQLESTYFSAPPDTPKLFPGGLFLILFWYPLWPIYYFFSYKKKKPEADKKYDLWLDKKRNAIAQVKDLL